MTVEEWLGEENQLGTDIWTKKYCNDGESFDEWITRISGGNEEIAEYIRKKKFLFGGRILSNRGLDQQGRKVTYSNCYVIDPPEDNIESIFDCAKKLARTYSYGGGCGVDISKLSPRGAKINNAAKETSGSVSFMELYSLVTALIGQNGRRGALMISIDCSHPDVEEFIDLKTDLDTRKAELQAKADATATDLAIVQAKLEAAKEAEAARITAEQETWQTSSSGGGSVTNGGAINVSADDVTLLAAIIQCEAVQDYNSLLAVATVIMNRVQSPRFPNSISGVIYASGQFEPVRTGRLQNVLNSGPTSLSRQVAQDAVNGARLAAVSHCYYFLYAPSTSRDGIVIGDNLFFSTW